MTRQKMVSQFLVVACCAAVVFAAGTDTIATALSAPSQTSVSPIELASSNVNCVGAAAFTSVVYMVNGHVVSSLNNNVTEGSNVTVHFTLKSGCDNTQVGIAGYQALSNHGNTQPFSLQTLVVHDDGTFSGTNAVSVTVPNCFFQVDFYTGGAAQPGDNYSTTGRLVASAVGGATTCASVGTTTTTIRSRQTTTTTALPSSNGSTTTTTSGDTTVTVEGLTINAPNVPDVPDNSTTTTTAHVQPAGTGTCAQTWPNDVTNYSVTAGGSTFSKLSSVKSGDTVVVHFTVMPNCHEQLSLASYEATSLDTSQSGVLSQTLFSSDTGTFGSGSWTLSVVIPSCMYQVDFVRGGVITHFGPIGSNNYYAGKIFDTAVGGTSECVSGNSQSTTTTTSTTSLTNQPNVGGEEVTRSTTTSTATPPTTAGSQVLGESLSRLPNTGFDLLPLLCLALGLMGIGGFMLGLARRDAGAVE